METAGLRYTIASAAFASLIWAAPLEARFLQVDPVGYDDQINLYAYVGNDPINGVDPTGTICTSSQVNGRTVYACRIDRIMRNGREVSRSSLTRNHQRQIRNFERRYTNAVNALMARDRRVTVGETAGQAGSSFEATSNETGTGLVARQFNYFPDESRRDALMGTTGRPEYRNVTTNIFRNGINSTPTDIAHEGLHRSRAEISGNRIWQDLGRYQREHQDPYNRAARDLLEE